MIDEKTLNFIKKANIIHYNLYNYSNSIYTKSFNKIKIICKKHGEFLQIANNHLQGSGCSACVNNKKINNDEFIKKANLVHNNKYNYKKTNYINSKQKIMIICNIHGVFYQSPFIHLKGFGCSKCNNCYKKSTNEFILKSNKVHNNKYLYDKTKYRNNRTKVVITCKIHGDFSQTPYSHLNGSGCIRCSGSARLTTQEFIYKAIKVHLNKYNYDNTTYVSNKKKITIICKKHGEFLQNPNSHLSGKGCPNCAVISSKNETRWLNSLEIKKENRQVCLPGLPQKYKVDGYDPETNTVYEFLGDYWHGNPEINKNIQKNNKYHKTIMREIKIRKAGYNYQFIWESDFKNLYHLK